MKQKSSYLCTKCEHRYAKWQGKCDQCGEWNSLQEVIAKPVSRSGGTKLIAAPARLIDVNAQSSDRIITQIGEFNRVMGGGIVKDSVTIITAKPGAGKSTLLLQVAQDLAEQGYKVLYASGEESDSQIKNRAERILPKIADNIWISANNNMNQLLEAIDQIDPNSVIVDSIRRLLLINIQPVQGHRHSRRWRRLRRSWRKQNEEQPRAVMIVGQMTKEDELAGVRALEHLVDTVLLIDDENTGELKLLSANKNRYGNTGETGFFMMTEKEGMISIENPYQYFITARDDVIPGVL